MFAGSSSGWPRSAARNPDSATARAAIGMNAEEYDSWYDRHPFAYESELAAVRALMPGGGKGLEVGVGTGRFASRLGIAVGLEPSGAMAAIARRRGVDVRIGTAERMPFDGAAFDFALAVAALNFLKDIPAGLREIGRVLRPGGSLLVGMIDFEPAVGRAYERRISDTGSFSGYSKLTVAETARLLGETGFAGFDCRQTVFRLPEEMTAPDEVRPGHGQGLFVVIRASLAGRAAPGLTPSASA